MYLEASHHQAQWAVEADSAPKARLTRTKMLPVACFLGDTS